VDRKRPAFICGTLTLPIAKPNERVQWLAGDSAASAVDEKYSCAVTSIVGTN